MAIGKASVISVLVAAVLLSAIIGFVAGFLAKDAQVGIGVSAVIIGVLAVVQASILGIDSVREK